MSSEWRDVQGVNQGYLLELYERFERDPASVDAAAREFFAAWKPDTALSAEPVASPQAAGAAGVDPEIIVGAVNLAQSIRRYGHLAA